MEKPVAILTTTTLNKFLNFIAELWLRNGVNDCLEAQSTTMHELARQFSGRLQTKRHDQEVMSMDILQCSGLKSERIDVRD